MRRNFRLYLTVTMIGFTIFVTTVVSFLDQSKLKSRIIQEYEMELMMVEDTIVESLHSIDKAYSLFDGEMAGKMQKYSNRLLSLYEENPQFSEWDFEALKREFEMDVYIINQDNVIIHSSFKDDIGLDFRSCCTEFSKLLDERRNKGEFVHDGMDLQQNNGEIKKYSYVPTPDRKYLLELGVSLEDGPIFQNYNFIETAAKLEAKFDLLDAIRIYNSEGYILGSNNNGIERPSERWNAFQTVVEKDMPEEVVGEWNESLAFYRYIPYKADIDRGISTNRIIEIVYNKNELNQLLSDSKKEFFFQLLAVIIVAVALSFMIARSVARPMYLAFHDSLTGLKNRAAFEELLKEYLKQEGKAPSLMMIDLDNFKLVNDTLGHGQGDHLLQVTAEIIRSYEKGSSVAARIGGDEFMVIFSNLNEEEVTQIASSLIEEINYRISEDGISKQIDVTVSIGIAFAEAGDDIESLYEKADFALYESKKNGKNQYQLFRSIGKARYV